MWYVELVKNKRPNERGLQNNQIVYPDGTKMIRQTFVQKNSREFDLYFFIISLGVTSATSFFPLCETTTSCRHKDHPALFPV